KLLGDQIKRVVPRDRRKFARTLRPDAAQRMQQAIGVMHALGIARHLGADHARGVGILLGTADAADGAPVDDLDFERAGRWTVVRAGRSADFWPDELVHY